MLQKKFLEEYYDLKIMDIFFFFNFERNIIEFSVDCLEL